MASRAKKKAASVNVETQKEIVVQKSTLDKWSKSYLATSIILLFFVFFMLMFAPIIGGTVKITAEGSTEDAEAQSFGASSLDIVIAPIRGCTSGFKFMLEKLGANFKNEETYEMVRSIAEKYIGVDKVNDIDELGVTTLVFTEILSVSALAMFVLAILSFALKNKRKLMYIGVCQFALINLVYFIYALVVNSKTLFTDSSIGAGWGCYLVFFAMIALVTINIVDFLKGRKVSKNESV